MGTFLAISRLHSIFKIQWRNRRRHKLNVSDDLPTTFENDTPSPSKGMYDMFNYNSALLSEGLLFMNVFDAMSEGDGERIMRQRTFLMLLCKEITPAGTSIPLSACTSCSLCME